VNILEDEWIKSDDVAKISVPRILKILKEILPEYDTTFIEEKGKEGYIPNPFVFEMSNVVEKKIVGGVMHLELGIMFLELSKMSLMDKREVHNLRIYLENSIGAFYRAVGVLINIDKTKELAAYAAILMTDLTNIAMELGEQSILENTIAATFALIDLPSDKSDKEHIALAISEGYKNNGQIKLSELALKISKEVINDEEGRNE